MTKRKSHGEAADQVEAYYRIWFEYLKEAKDYLAYCDLKARGEQSILTLSNQRTEEDARKELGFMHLHGVFGDPRTAEFEDIKSSMQYIFDPIAEARQYIYEDIVGGLELGKSISGKYPSIKKLLYKKRFRAPYLPYDDIELRQIIADNETLKGYFYVRVFPGVTDIETLKEKLGKLVEKKMAEINAMPHLEREWASVFWPPRKSKLRVPEWTNYLKAYRLRENEKLTFGKIAKVLQEDEKKVNEWHKKAVKIIDRVNKGLPIVSPMNEGRANGLPS